MKIVYATDVHGNKRIYERVFREAKEKDMDAVLIGGDITPLDAFFSELMRSQREFLRAWLIPRLEQFRKETGKPVFMIMGNDDFSINLDLLMKAEKDGLLVLAHGKVTAIGDYSVMGYSFINHSPFIIKDWEREESMMLRDMKELHAKAGGKKVIVLTHAPPFGTPLDVLYDGSHVGSSAMREYIEKFQPFLYLCGHIHESPAMSGVSVHKAGKTVCLNPGNHSMCVIDLGEPAKMRRFRII